MPQNLFSIHGRFSRTRFHAQAHGFVMVVIGLCTLGCGNKERFPNDPNLVKISGVVTIDGQPTQYVRVVLATEKIVQGTKARSIDQVGGPCGVTNEKGAFSITSTRLNDGILPGDYIAVFEWNPPVTQEDLTSGLPVVEALQRRYPSILEFREKYAAGNPGNMPIKVEAKKPQTDLKFDLTTK